MRWLIVTLLLVACNRKAEKIEAQCRLEAVEDYESCMDDCKEDCEEASEASCSSVGCEIDCQEAKLDDEQVCRDLAELARQI